MKNTVVATVILAAGLTATSAIAEEWNTISAGDRVAYLADISSIATVGDVTTIRVARVTLPVKVGDYGHKVNEYTVRCGANQSRIVMEVEYGQDGAEVDRYPDAEAEWDRPAANTLGAFVKGIACNGERGEGANVDSIQTYIDGKAG